MDMYTSHDSTVSVVDGDAGGDLDALSNTNVLLGAVSSNGEGLRELRSANEFLTRLGLDISCASEKLMNLSILMMHVAAKECDLEVGLEKEDAPTNSAVKALEFDFLCGIFDSEIKQLDGFITTLQGDIVTAREIMPSHKYLGEVLLVMEEKSHDSEESLKQLRDQASDMRLQSAKFQRILSRIRAKENLDDEKLHNAEKWDLLDMDVKIKMHTSEQQKLILRMLEKSLARELDLENELSESRQVEEELKLQLHYSEQEVLSMEKETVALFQQFVEADNTAGVLMGISKELIGHLQLSQLSLNNAVQRESELRSKLQHSSEVATLKGQIMELKEKAAMEESRAGAMDAKCKLLEDTCKKLIEELGATQKVESLERQLHEADIKLQQAVAAIDEGQEKQSMLYSSISDMELLIEDLKSKASKAEYLADNAEKKSIILSESNAELTEELNYLRGRVEYLEASIHQEQETKIAVAKEINVRSAVITDLVMQLAAERERLKSQISSSMKESRFLAQKLQEVTNLPSIKTSHDGRDKSKEYISSECDVAIAAARKDTKEKEELFVSNEPRKEPGEELDGDGEAESDPADLESKLETVRTIDAGRLDLKFILVALLMTLITTIAACFLEQEN